MSGKTAKCYWCGKQFGEFAYIVPYTSHILCSDCSESDEKEESK